MANDADATTHAVNGSTMLSTSTVPELSEQADETAARASRARSGELLTDENEDHAAEEVIGAATPVAADEDPGDADDHGPEPTAPRRSPGIRVALAVGLVTLLALGGLAGWLGYGVYRNHQTDKMRNLFLAVGRQGALNLTTIDYAEADADIQRILDSATGQFYDDFSKRAPAFVEVVKQAQAKTVGNIVEAGLESFNGESARVLAAVLVTTSNKGATDQQPRHWRMRIDVQKVGSVAKVANVGFVP